MKSPVTRLLAIALSTGPLPAALAHGGHAAEDLTSLQHLFIHLGNGWMLLVGVVIAVKLYSLFRASHRRSKSVPE